VVKGLDLTSTAGTQQLHQDRYFQLTEHSHRPHQIHQPQAPDAASDRPSPHITFPALKDCYDRWSLKLWIKWTHETL